MKRLISTILIISLLLQPLTLVPPVLAETIKMKYTDPNHLHAPKEVNGVAYQYDANGNLTDDGERTITWNQDNLPVKIVKGGKTVEFFYDASGGRIAKKSEEGETIYVNQYYQQSVISNQPSATKYYFANGRVAQRTGDNLVFLHQDHLGSTVLATNSNSQPLSNSLSYFPYGSSISNEQLTISNYLFTGQESDPESDLYNYNARLYNPRTGAFISADTVGGGNRYAYAENNPMMFTDPSGHAVDAGDGGGDSNRLGNGLGITVTSASMKSYGISATTPINPTIRYDSYNPDPSYYDPYSYGPQGEFEQLVVGMAFFSSAAVTAVLSVPVAAAEVASAWRYLKNTWAKWQAGKEIGGGATFSGEDAIRQEWGIKDRSVPLPDELTMFKNGNVTLVEKKTSANNIGHAVRVQLPSGAQQLWQAQGNNVNKVQLYLKINSSTDWQRLTTLDRANGTVMGWAVDLEGFLVRFNQATEIFERYLVNSPYGQLPVTVIQGQ